MSLRHEALPQPVRRREVIRDLGKFVGQRDGPEVPVLLWLRVSVRQRASVVLIPRPQRIEGIAMCAVAGQVHEFVRVVTHPRVFRRPWGISDAWAFVETLLSSPSLGVLTHTPRHGAVAAQTLGEVPGLRGNLVHDAHTAILMREHGIRRVYTRDTDFHRFPFLAVIDPLA